MRRNALDDAPRNVCDCGLEIALVDQAVNKKTKAAKGGKWVHVELPADPNNVHLARPKGNK